MKVRTLTRLPKSKIEELKLLAKTELTFKVRFQVNREKYGKGTFNLLPTKSNGNKFTEDQVLEIFDWMEKNHLHTQSFATTNKNPQAYWQSIGYILGTTS